MKTLTFIIIIFFGCSFKTIGQTKDSIDGYDKAAKYFRYDTYEYTSTKNESWAKNSRTKTFENQGYMHSIYIALKSDSTFVFLSIYEPGEFLSVGRWTKKNDTTFILTWDEVKSMNICRDSKVYQKYYKYGWPLPMKIENWVFLKKNNNLMPVAKRLVN